MNEKHIKTSNSKLAILGGPPVRHEPLPVYKTIGDEEKQAVLDVLDSGELSGFVAGAVEGFWGGPRVRALEIAFRDHFGVTHAIAVNSATSGLHCAVSATGAGPGDEVITSPYSMSASATCILMTGAVPVFADINAETFCLDPASVEANVTPHTKGIVAVSIFGHPADLDALRDIARRHGLFLIEDNAQAPDAVYKGRKTGTVGDAGVFSFNRHKTMQSGEGGVIITDDDTLAFKAACMRNHGEGAVEDFGVEDLVNTVGVNYRMTEMEGRRRPLSIPQATSAERRTDQTGRPADAGIVANSGHYSADDPERLHARLLFLRDDLRRRDSRYTARAIREVGTGRRLLPSRRLRKTDLPRAGIPTEDLFRGRRLSVQREPAQRAVVV